jgi:hypothetical protein
MKNFKITILCTIENYSIIRGWETMPLLFVVLKDKKSNFCVKSLIITEVCDIIPNNMNNERKMLNDRF